MCIPPDEADPLPHFRLLRSIAQANGLVRCPPSCLRHFERFQQMPRPEGRTRIRYVKRSQNLAGIALAALHAR